MKAQHLPVIHETGPQVMLHPSLLAGLAWLRRLLSWQIQVTRATFVQLADDPYRGLYVSDAEADILAADWPPLPVELVTARQQLQAERDAFTPAGDSPLDRLVQRLGLSAFEANIVLLALAPELDSRFERLYGYIQDDVTRKRATVDLALRLFGNDPAERLQLRALLTADAPLLRYGLVRLIDDPARPSALLTQAVVLDERIVGEALGQPTLDVALRHCTTVLDPTEAHEPLLDAVWLEQVRAFVSAHPEKLILGLSGVYGSGRREVALALAKQAGRPLLCVHVDAVLTSDYSAREALERLERECLLRDAWLLLTGCTEILNSPNDTRQPSLLAFLDRCRGTVILALERPWEARGDLQQVAYLHQELPTLGYVQREQVWREALGDDAPDAALLARLGSTFRLSSGQIRDAAALARTLARWRDSRATPSATDLFAASRAQSSGKLDALAQKLRPTYRWDDLVLPASHLAQLREVAIQVRQRRVVLESWGFDRHLAFGKGVNVLFGGPSGTGKTMAAEVIAAELGLELYRVDLATMVSKYIGETEKNLDKIFQAAREANAILFFDEADAIFGKRSEVKDSHDRYANIEVGYLLQKMESYDGLVVLATNLSKNMDEAFVRRLHVAIEFPLPEEPDRLRIWANVFPAAMPRSHDIDLEFLAKQFRLTGGNIRNIALLAAFLAAEDQHAVSMRHLILATRREYQKLGRLITANDFGPYLALARQ